MSRLQIHIYIWMGWDGKKINERDASNRRVILIAWLCHRSKTHYLNCNHDPLNPSLEQRKKSHFQKEKSCIEKLFVRLYNWTWCVYASPRKAELTTQKKRWWMVCYLNDLSSDCLHRSTTRHNNHFEMDNESVCIN